MKKSLTIMTLVSGFVFCVISCITVAVYAKDFIVKIKETTSIWKNPKHN